MRTWYLPALAIVVLLLRLPYFNSPSIHIDEQFYLDVADKWVHQGLLPFVDIWDRKPIGTFAIYAIAVLLFENAILGYQLVAAVFVIATCAVILKLSDLYRAPSIGFMAAAVYAVATMLMEGPGGQTPVFYNLPVAGAAYLYLRAAAHAGDAAPRAWAPSLLGGSLLLGLAIQIKYICALESAALSLFVLTALYVRRGARLAHLVAVAMGMAVLGVLPTAAVASWYAAMGHFDAFFETNVASIFAKRLWHLPLFEIFRRFRESSLFCIFFLPFAALALWSLWRDPHDRMRRWFLAGLAVWILAAFVGALMLGNPTRHYFLPTLVPLAFLTAVGLDRAGRLPATPGRVFSALQARWGGYGALAVVLTVPVIASYYIAYANPRERGEAADVYAVGTYIRGNLTSGCPFIFNRLPILYYLGQACAPSVFAFPNHLSEIAEVRTPGRERLTELARVLESRPPMIYVRRPYSADLDAEAIGMLEQTLRAHYRIAFARRAWRQVHLIYEPKDE